MVKGDRIKTLRIKKGIAQKEMAKILDTTPNYILGWENA